MRMDFVAFEELLSRVGVDFTASINILDQTHVFSHDYYDL